MVGTLIISGPGDFASNLWSPTTSTIYNTGSLADFVLDRHRFGRKCYGSAEWSSPRRPESSLDLSAQFANCLYSSWHDDHGSSGLFMFQAAYLPPRSDSALRGEAIFKPQIQWRLGGLKLLYVDKMGILFTWAAAEFYQAGFISRNAVGMVDRFRSDASHSDFQPAIRSRLWASIAILLHRSIEC